MKLLTSLNQITKPLLISAAFVSIVNCGGGNTGVSEAERVDAIVDTVTASTLPAAIDGIFDTQVNSDRAGVAMIIKQHGDIIYSNAKGKANISENIDITLDTPFRLASISKTFTAIAIMQLVEAGKLRLSDNIGVYLPYLSNNYQRITIEQLLTHSSGIPDFINDFGPGDWLAYDGLTNKGLIQFYNGATELEFEPGSESQYSNTGYILLAEIIESVSNETFENYMQQHIFQPAGMSNSYAIDGDFPRAIDEALNYGSEIDVLGFNSQTHGSSGQVSSAQDFAHFFTALKNNTLITAQSFELMIERRVWVNTDSIYYGYGWIIANPNSTKVWHSGGYDGYQTLMYVDTQNDYEIVILTNGGAGTREIYNAMLDVTNSFLSQ